MDLDIHKYPVRCLYHFRVFYMIFFITSIICFFWKTYLFVSVYVDFYQQCWKACEQNTTWQANSCLQWHGRDLFSKPPFVSSMFPEGILLLYLCFHILLFKWSKAVAEANACLIFSDFQQFIQIVCSSSQGAMHLRFVWYQKVWAQWVGTSYWM